MINDLKIEKTGLDFRMSELKPRSLNKIYLLILHHTASKDGDIYAINSAHRKKGWAGVGYHYLILKDGTIQEGRPINYIGAHCAGNNASSIGIALLGDFRYEKPTEEQIKSLKALKKYLFAKVPSLKRVLNHNDLYKTLCPVVDLKAMI